MEDSDYKKELLYILKCFNFIFKADITLSDLRVGNPSNEFSFKHKNELVNVDIITWGRTTVYGRRWTMFFEIEPYSRSVLLIYMFFLI